MVHIPNTFKNTIVSYSDYNFPVRTSSDNSFATILTNNELYRTKPHVLSYKYISYRLCNIPIFFNFGIKLNLKLLIAMLA
jgi:hypothetical protein